MTIRNLNNYNRDIGNYISQKRALLTDLPKSRQAFIDNRSKLLFNNEEWISEKTLSNYENGKNIPNLVNLKNFQLL